MSQEMEKLELWNECLQHAFEEAAVGIEIWEYAGAESKEEEVMTKKAAKEVARLIRAMAIRRYRAFHAKAAKVL